MNPTNPTQEDPAYAAVYCDAVRFPLTTQKGLSLQKQKMIDAINMDDLREAIENGQALTAEHQAIAREFEDKAKLHQGRPAPAAPPAGAPASAGRVAVAPPAA